MSPASRRHAAAVTFALAALAAALVAPEGVAAPQQGLVPGPPGRDAVWTARLIAPVAALSAPVTGRLIERQSDFGSWSGGPVRC